MSESFIVTVVIAVLVVAFWRIVLPLLLALLIALLVTGIGSVVNAVEGSGSQSQVVAPTAPAPGDQPVPGQGHG